MPDVADLRRDYQRAGLRRADLAKTWHEQLAAWLEAAVAAGVIEPTAMTLATADATGRPSARTVLLKGLNAQGVVFFTHAGSRKGRDLAANPRVAAVLRWDVLERQVTVLGAAHPVPAEESDAYFASRPRGSRVGAWASPQSQVVAGRDELEEAYARMEQRFAGTDPPRPPSWGGYRIVPDEVEFWQGRPSRMHDRLRFTATSGVWVVQRLGS